jgi:hypothetical protein
VITDYIVTKPFLLNGDQMRAGDQMPASTPVEILSRLVNNHRVAQRMTRADGTVQLLRLPVETMRKVPTAIPRQPAAAPAPEASSPAPAHGQPAAEIATSGALVRPGETPKRPWLRRHRSRLGLAVGGPQPLPPEKSGLV